MKKRQILCLLIGLNLLWLAACGTAPTPLPSPTETAVSQTISPTETATEEPATAVPATATIAQPTREPLFPTPEVTPTPTITPTLALPDYELTIAEPAPDTMLIAGQEVTFRGAVQPPTADPISVTITIGSFTAVSAQISPDATTGDWELSTTLASTISGPGLLTVSLGDLAQTEQPIQLAFDRSAAEPYIALSKPVQGETAVAGYTFFFHGDSNNLIDDAFTIGVLVDDCTNFIAAQKISLSNGRWFGFVILPQNAAAGSACAIAYTGEYEADGWRAAQIPIQLRAFDDPQVTLLTLGNLAEPIFRIDQATNLFGVAVNLPERAVNIELVLDSASSGSQLVATGKAFADQFGFWSIDLEIPANAPSGQGLLTISGGDGDNYQEIRQTVTISP